MADELDIYRTAYVLVELHGDDAPTRLIHHRLLDCHKTLGIFSVAAR